MAGFEAGNTDYTRRSHIVRVSEAGASGAADTGDGASGGNGGTYVDVEVLDAIAFRIEDNKEVILDMSKPVFFRTDDTGDGNDDTAAGSDATRRSHMKRITSADGTKFFDIEVIDAAAFRDQNGYEWILTMPTSDQGSSDFNSTDNTGDVDATRRVHTELISQDLTDAKPSSYLQVIRNDAMAFRGPGNREVVLVTPSNNDPNASDKAAVTFTTPENYDPTDASGTPPPAPDASEPGVYFAFVDGSDGVFINDDASIEMGPLWWIRKVGSGAILFVFIEYQIDCTGATPVRPTATLKMPYGTKSWDALTKVDEPLPGQKPAPVVNPVTDAMLSTLYQWSPVPPLVETKSLPLDGASQTLYVVVDTYTQIAFEANYGITIPTMTKDNYGMNVDYGNVDTGLPPITIVQAYAAQQLRTAGVAPGAPLPPFYVTEWETLGFDPVRINNLATQSPIFQSAADASYAAAADLAMWRSIAPDFPVSVTTAALVLSQPGNASLAGRAVFAMNLSQVIPAIQASAVDGQPPPPIQFELDVSISAPADNSTDFSGATLSVTAQAFKTLRDFPVDPTTGLPTFQFPATSPIDKAKEGKSDSTSVGVSGPGGGNKNSVFTGTIDPKTFDITLAAT